MCGLWKFGFMWFSYIWFLKIKIFGKKITEYATSVMSKLPCSACSEAKISTMQAVGPVIFCSRTYMSMDILVQYIQKDQVFCPSRTGLLNVDNLGFCGFFFVYAVYKFEFWSADSENLHVCDFHHSDFGFLKKKIFWKKKFLLWIYEVRHWNFDLLTLKIYMYVIFIILTLVFKNKNFWEKIHGVR